MTELLNTVTQGDCLETMRRLDDNSVNLIVIDPPYNIGIKGEAWDRYKPEEYFEFMALVFKECERVLKPNGSFYWFHNDMPQIARLMTDLDRDTAFVFNSFITWDKGDWRALSWKNPSEKSNLRCWFNTAEYCLLYTMPDTSGWGETGWEKILMDTNNFRPIKDYLQYELRKKGLRWNSAELIELYREHGFKDPVRVLQHKLDDADKQFQFLTRRHYDILSVYLEWEKSYEQLREEYEQLREEYEEKRLELEAMRFTHNLDANHKNVWTYKTENTGKYHACQKPLTVVERIIKTSSNPGDIVLDCFLGSGTTAVAAINTGRQFIGIEREPEYVAIANERIEATKKALSDKPGA